VCVEIRYTKQAIKYLLKLQAKKAAKIKGTIKRIDEGNTEGLNIVYMKNLDVYRVRIGDFRVIYEIQDDELVLIVIKVGLRGDVYK